MVPMRVLRWHIGVSVEPEMQREHPPALRISPRERVFLRAEATDSMWLLGALRSTHRLAAPELTGLSFSVVASARLPVRFIRE
jgi:hypothetical protein